MYWVYVLENSYGRFYVGQTNDLERRLNEHNNPKNASSKYTPKSGPWKLVYKEEYLTRSEAMVREKQVKSKKSACWIREQLIR